MRRLGTWVTAMALVTAAAAPAVAQMPGGMPPGPPPSERIGAALGLTEQQKASWDAARQNIMTASKPARDQARALHQELEALLNQANADPAAVGQKMIELHALRQQLRASHEAMENALAALLTPEQKAKLDEMKAAHRGHRGGPPRS